MIDPLAGLDFEPAPITCDDCEAPPFFRLTVPTCGHAMLGCVGHAQRRLGATVTSGVCPICGGPVNGALGLSPLEARP